jgi:heme exporter protein D
MTYQNYVIAAYLVFLAVLLWDFVAPRIGMRQLLRAARARVARQTVQQPGPEGNEPLMHP